MNAIGSQFAADLAAVLQRPVSSIWGSNARDEKSAAPKVSLASQMTSFDALGQVDNFAAMLSADGWKQGDKIKRKSDDRTFTLVAIGAVCTIRDKAGVETTVRADAFLKKNFMKDVAQEIECVDGWAEQADGTKTFEWRLAKTVGTIIHALDDLEVKHPSREGLRIVAKPPSSRGVYAEKAFAKGALVLVPVSTQVVAKKPAETAKGLEVDLGITLQDNSDKGRKVADHALPRLPASRFTAPGAAYTLREVVSCEGCRAEEGRWHHGSHRWSTLVISRSWSIRRCRSHAMDSPILASGARH